ncbi:hypothetical protein ABK040_016873 [Willaertia magna]
MNPNYCRNSDFCSETHDPNHKNKYLHCCKHSSECRKLHIEKHTEWFVHPCPFKRNCTLLDDKYHNITFKHPKEPSLIAKLFFWFDGTTQSNDTVKIRCPHWDKCNKTNDQEHTDQFYHPCKYGLSCRYSSDKHHCTRFLHPCKYGDECYDKSTSHRFYFMHEDRKPEWLPCHGAKEESNTINKISNNGSSYKTNQNYSNNIHGSNSNTTNVTQYQQPISSNNNYMHTNNSMANNNYNLRNQNIYPTPQYPPHNGIHQYYNNNNKGSNYMMISGNTNKYNEIQRNDYFNNSNNGTAINQHYNHINNNPNTTTIASFPSNHFTHNNNFVNNNKMYNNINNTLLVCSFNILASAYASNERYTNIQNKNFLTWNHRGPLIFQTLSDRPYDIIALQEVDQKKEGIFYEFAKNNGYYIIYTEKKAPKKDGIVLLVKQQRFNKLSGGEEQIIKEYPETYQYYILQDTFTHAVFIVMNCHLNFTPNEIKPREQQVQRMIHILISLAQQVAQKTTNYSVLLMGDFNTLPNESPIKFIESEKQLGLMKSHNDHNFWSFCNTRSEKKVVDYIWFNNRLKVLSCDPHPSTLPTTDIPNEYIGSDHLPLVTTFQII